MGDVTTPEKTQKKRKRATTSTEPAPKRAGDANGKGRCLKKELSEVSLDSQGWPKDLASWSAPPVAVGSEDMARAKADALERGAKLPGKRNSIKKQATAVAPTAAPKGMTVNSRKFGTTRLSHYSTKSYIQHKVEQRWKSLVNCQYPRDALPHVIDAYRQIMHKVFKMITQDKNATREKAIQLKNELVSSTIKDGVLEESDDNMPEELDDSKHNEGDDSSCDEEQWKVHNWFDFGCFL